MKTDTDAEPASRSEQDWSVLRVGGLLLLALAIPVLWALWNGWTGSQVVASRPIGTLQRISASDHHFVLETETGFYPLLRPMRGTRGTALVLELRRNGEHQICDAARTRCVPTSHD